MHGHICVSPNLPYRRHILSYEHTLNPPGKSAEMVLTVSRQRREIESVCSLGMEWAKHGMPISSYRCVCSLGKPSQLITFSGVYKQRLSLPSSDDITQAPPLLHIRPTFIARCILKEGV